MNSRRLIGDAPRLFRVSLSRFRLGGNRLIAGVFAAPQESAPGPTRKEGVGVNHWRLTVYQRTCRGLGSPVVHVGQRPRDGPQQPERRRLWANNIAATFDGKATTRHHPRRGVIGRWRAAIVRLPA